MKNISRRFTTEINIFRFRASTNIEIYKIALNNKQSRDKLNTHIFLTEVFQKVHTITPLFSTGLYFQPTKYLINESRKQTN